jgi:hypothetical protein
LLSTGVCWCGCGSCVSPGRFFLRGHDKRALARFIRSQYGDAGSIAELLADHNEHPEAKKGFV